MKQKKTTHLLLASASIIFILSGCGNSEKPNYVLTDSMLYQYKGGEVLRYGVVSLGSDATGVLTHTFDADNLITPPATLGGASGATLPAIIRNTSVEGGVPFSFPAPYFTQNENGDFIIEAFEDGGSVFWLSDTSENRLSTELYPSPLSDLAAQTAENRSLFIYDENKNRMPSGTTDLVIIPLGVEKTETDYATFEAYKINIDWSVTTPDNSFALTGNQWVYPPLGIVRFDYTITSTTVSSGIFGTLTATNIQIAAENKK